MPRYQFAAPKSSPTTAAKRGETYTTSLEKSYPRILYAIQAMWGHKELNQYFNQLTLDNRGGREGFPPDAWDEIYTLMLLHQELIPTPIF